MQRGLGPITTRYQTLQPLETYSLAQEQLFRPAVTLLSGGVAGVRRGAWRLAAGKKAALAPVGQRQNPWIALLHLDFSDEYP